MQKQTISRVGIDLDGTVADYMSGVVPLLKEYYGLAPNFSGSPRTIEEVFGLTRENRPRGMRKKLYEELHLFRDLPKLEEDVEDLTHRLRRDGVKVYFVTARAGTHVIREDTIEWLDKNGFYYDDVFHTENKAELCKHTRIHAMYEDELGQVLGMQRANINVALRDQPWNRLLPEDPGRRRGKITRVHSWCEAYNTMEEYLK